MRYEMATKPVQIRKISWKALCKAVDKNMKEKITVYEFKGRKFQEAQDKPAGY